MSYITEVIECIVFFINATQDGFLKSDFCQFVNFEHASRIEYTDKVGHKTEAPGPLACPCHGVRPLACPCRSARPRKCLNLT